MLCRFKNVLQQRRIILASTSDRRKQIFSGLEFPFEVMSSPFDEEANRLDTEDPIEFTKWTASQKAKATLDSLRNEENLPNFVIGADTIVVYDSKILGKPGSVDGAKQMLKTLSGNNHEVVTGVSIFYLGPSGYQERIFAEKTRVKMTHLCDQTIESYVASGEPMDKAGAYGIQSLGGTLIESIEGDYWNVVGFPLHRFAVEMIKILQELDEH